MHVVSLWNRKIDKKLILNELSSKSVNCKVKTRENSADKKKSKVKSKTTKSSKVCPIENNTNLNSIFCLIKSQKKLFYFFTCILPD